MPAWRIEPGAGRGPEPSGPLGGGDHASLRCGLCRDVASRLHSATWTVSLPTGEVVRRGDLLCEPCLRDLRKRLSDEEVFAQPPE